MDREDENETLVHQIVSLKVEKEVEEINDWIRRVNREGWDLYILPEDPSYNQLQRQDDELQRLYSKVSENRPCDRQERMKILNARQSVRELIEMYSVYDSISHPVDDPEITDSEDEGGVANAV